MAQEFVSDVEQYQDFDVFFYYGYNKLEIETRSDIYQNILQPKRSLYYGRNEDSAGAPSYENQPNGLTLQINLPYDIVMSLAKRNQRVSNGDGDYPDRRVAVSQSTIRAEAEGSSVRVSVLYIPLANYRQTDVVSTLLNAGAL